MPQTQERYLTRDSPPYPANKCCGYKKLGNDGTTYLSKRGSNGVCRWVPTHSIETEILMKNAHERGLDLEIVSRRNWDSQQYLDYDSLKKRHKTEEKVQKQLREMIEFFDEELDAVYKLLGREEYYHRKGMTLPK